MNKNSRTLCSSVEVTAEASVDGCNTRQRNLINMSLQELHEMLNILCSSSSGLLLFIDVHFELLLLLL